MVGAVVIGMDPHKRSATIGVIDERENVLAQGRFGTDTDGYRRMLAGPQVPAADLGGGGLQRHRPAHRPTPGRRR
jgi:transposase